MLRSNSKFKATNELKQLIKKFPKYANETKNQQKERRTSMIGNLRKVKDDEQYILKQKLLEFIKQNMKEKDIKNQVKNFFGFLCNEYYKNINNVLQTSKVINGQINDDNVIDFIRNFYEFEDELFIMKQNVIDKVMKEDDSYQAAVISCMIILKQVELVDCIIEKDSELQDIGVKTVIILYIFNRIHRYKNNTDNKEIIQFIEKSTNILLPLFVNLLNEIIDDPELKTIFLLINSDNLSKMFNDLSHFTVIRKSLYDIILKVNITSKDGIKIRTLKNYIIDNRCLEGLLSTLKNMYMSNTIIMFEDIFKEVINILIIINAFYEVEMPEMKTEIFSFLFKIFEDLLQTDDMFRQLGPNFVNELLALSYMDKDDLKQKITSFKNIDTIQSTFQYSTAMFKDVDIINFLINLFTDCDMSINQEENVILLRKSILMGILDIDLNLNKYKYLVNNTLYCSQILENLYKYSEELTSHSFNTIILIISDNTSTIENYNLNYIPEKEIKAIFKHLEECNCEERLKAIFKYFSTFLNLTNTFQKIFLNCGFLNKLKEIFDKTLKGLDVPTNGEALSPEILMCFINFFEIIYNGNNEYRSHIKNFGFLENYFNKFTEYSDYKLIAYNIWSICMTFETDNNDIQKFTKMLTRRYNTLKEHLKRSKNIELFKITFSEIYSINQILIQNFLKMEKISKIKQNFHFLKDIILDFIPLITSARIWKNEPASTDETEEISNFINLSSITTERAILDEVEKSYYWDNDLHIYMRKYFILFFDLILFFNEKVFEYKFKSIKNGIKKREENLNLDSFISKKDLKCGISMSLTYLNRLDDNKFMLDLLGFFLDKSLKLCNSNYKRSSIFNTSSDLKYINITSLFLDKYSIPSNNYNPSISNYSNLILQNPLIIKYTLSTLVKLDNKNYIMLILYFIELISKTNENSIKLMIKKRLVKKLLELIQKDDKEILARVVDIFQIITKFLPKNDLKELTDFILISNKTNTAVANTFARILQKSLKLSKKIKRSIILASITTRQPNVYNMLYTGNLKFSKFKNKLTHLSIFLSLKFHKSLDNSIFSLFKLEKENNKENSNLEVFIENNLLIIKTEKDKANCDQFSKYIRYDKTTNFLFIFIKEQNLMEIYINEKLVSHFSIDLKFLDTTSTYCLTTGYLHSNRELYHDKFDSFPHITLSYFMIYTDKITTENMINFKLSQIFNSKNGTCKANKIKLKYLDNKTYKMIAPNYINNKKILKYIKLNIDPEKVVYELVIDEIGMLTNNKLQKLQQASHITLTKMPRRYFIEILEKDFVLYIPNTNFSDGENSMFNNTYLIAKNNISDIVHFCEIYDFKNIKTVLLTDVFNISSVIDCHIQSFKFIEYMLAIINNAVNAESMMNYFKLLGTYLLYNMNILSKFCSSEHFKVMLVCLYKNSNLITKGLIDFFFNMSIGLEELKDINFFNPLYPGFILDILLDVYLFKSLGSELQNYIIDTLRLFYQKYIFILYDGNFDIKVEVIGKLFKLLMIVNNDNSIDISPLDENIIGLISILLEQTLLIKKGEIYEPNEGQLRRVIAFTNEFFEIAGYFEEAIEYHFKKKSKLSQEEIHITYGVMTEVFRKLYDAKINSILRKVLISFYKIYQDLNGKKTNSNIYKKVTNLLIESKFLKLYDKEIAQRPQSLSYESKKMAKSMNNISFFNEKGIRKFSDNNNTYNTEWTIVNKDKLPETDNDPDGCKDNRCIRCNFFREYILHDLKTVLNFNNYKKYLDKFYYFLFISNPDHPFLKILNINYSYNIYNHEGPARIRNKLIPRKNRINNIELTKKYYQDPNTVISNVEKKFEFINVKQLLSNVFFCDQIFNLNLVNSIVDQDEKPQLTTNCLLVKDCYQIDCTIILTENSFYLLLNTHVDNDGNLTYSNNKFKRFFWVVNDYKEEINKTCIYLNRFEEQQESQLQQENRNSQLLHDNEYDKKKRMEKIKVKKFLRGRNDFEMFKTSYSDINELHKRRFLLKHNSLEIFMKNGKNFLLAFNVDKRDKVFEIIVRNIKELKGSNISTSILASPYSIFMRNTKLIHKKSKGKTNISEPGIVETKDILEESREYWEKGIISNYEYLIILNTLAGRSFNDLAQYMTMPWILKEYTLEGLNLNTDSIYRDLSRPIYAIDDNTYKNLMLKYSEADDIDKFHSGSHYSTPGFVCYFLIRLKPFSLISAEIQGGFFDMADRLFYNIKGLWEVSDKYQELIPEMFYFPEAFVNYNEFDFGSNHNQIKVNDVILPKWAKTHPRLYVKMNKKALESSKLSAKINDWIDLIFGFKQQGKDAIKSLNTFRALCYEGKIDINKLDEKEREDKMMEIHDFGQIPIQLYTKPHPKRDCHEKCAAFFSRPAYMINFVECKEKDSVYKSYNIKLETKPTQMKGYYEFRGNSCNGEGGLSSFRLHIDPEDKSTKFSDSMNTFMIVGDRKVLLGPKNKILVDWSQNKYSFSIINPLAKISFDFNTNRESPIADIKATYDGKRLLIAYQDGGLEIYDIIKDKQRVLNPEIECKTYKNFFRIFAKQDSNPKNQITKLPSQEAEDKTVEFNTKLKISYFTEDCKDFFIHYNQSGININKNMNKGSACYDISLIKSENVINNPIKLIELNESYSILIVIDMSNKIYIFDLNKLRLLRELNFEKITKSTQQIFSISIDSLTGEFVVITSYMVVLFNINGVLLATLNLKEHPNISKITCAIVKSLRNTESEIHLFTGHENGTFYLWRLNINNLLLEEDLEEFSNIEFLDSYRFAYNYNYYKEHVKKSFELKLKFGDSNEFHTTKDIPLRMIKLSEDNSIMITIHDDMSLNYWSYFDMNKKANKNKVKICTQCNNQIGGSKIHCSLCEKKLCTQCKIVEILPEISLKTMNPICNDCLSMISSTNKMLYDF